jgi:hypothetical protein
MSWEKLAAAVIVRPATFDGRRGLLEQLAATWHPPLNLSPVTADRDVATEWFETYPAAGIEGLVIKGGAQPYPASPACDGRDGAPGDPRSPARGVLDGPALDVEVEGAHRDEQVPDALLELSHLSVRQYRRPNGEVVALLVVTPSKSDRERVIPMSPELLHVIAQVVRRHTDQFGAIPLVRRWDPYERQHSDPLPFLFQHSPGQVRGVMSPTSTAKLIRTACEQVAARRPQFDGLTFTPHDFRRLFATDLVNNGLPIHIGAALLGHASLQTTRGYVTRGRIDEDVVRHYQLHLTRRRQMRPNDEYRDATKAEWQEFEEHFDKRKVELGACGRPYGTPCAHEHAPFDARCSTSSPKCCLGWTRSKRTSSLVGVVPRARAGAARSRASR